jgi:uncharacterized membrane protein
LDLTTRTHQRLLAVVAAILVATVVGLILLWPSATALPDLGEPPEPLVSGRILDVEVVGVSDDPTFEGGSVATVTVEVLEGPDEGAVIDLVADLTGYPEFGAGDGVELARSVSPEGRVDYFITDFPRLPTLALLIGMFVAAVLLVGRFHGARSLLGLALSLFLVVRFIVPAILGGAHPPLVALVGALAVMVVTLYLAHGVNEMTTAAIVGTAGALTLTVVLGLVFIDLASITGFASEDAVFARQQVVGLDLQGLVLAGLIIAALGVLDDVTVSQASTVFALHDTDRTLHFGALFNRAMKVGRDHIASVVNTLFLAYAGASLPLLVVFSTGGLGTGEIINSEVLAVEIVKTVVGSLGLIAAVPLTTALASAVAVRRPADAPVVPVHVHAHGPDDVPSHHHGADADDEPPVGEEDEETRAARAWARYLRHQGIEPEDGTPPEDDTPPEDGGPPREGRGGAPGDAD